MIPVFALARRRIPLTAAFALAAVVSLAAPGTAAAAADPAEELTAGNAALAYWQAFAAMPSDAAEVGIIDNWSTTAFDKASLALLDSSAYALSELRRGARMKSCDWGMDYNRGPELRMPHLAKSRQLARLAMLRARHHFEHGKPRDGVVDALSALKLGHDAGADPILIAILVQHGVEGMSIDLLARHLPKLSREELDQLAQTLDKLPSGDRTKDVWATEAKYMVDWFGERLAKAAEQGEDSWQDRVLAMPIFGEDERAKLKAAGVPPLAEMREQLETIRRYYRELEKVTDAPPAEQNAAVDAFLKGVEVDSALFHILVPAVNRVFHVRHRAAAKSAMFRAALAVQRGGPERLKEPAHADPYGQGPFEHRQTGEGFELQSRLSHENGKPVSLTVGAAKP